MWEIEMGQTLVEAGEATVGYAWLFASLMSVMLMLVAERVLTVKQYQRSVLRRILSANGHWMIVMRPRWLEERRTWTKVRLRWQMVGY